MTNGERIERMERAFAATYKSGQGYREGIEAALAAAGVEKLEAELAEARRDAEQFSYLLYRAVDMLHECGLRDEIWVALEGKP